MIQEKLVAEARLTELELVAQSWAAVEDSLGDLVNRYVEVRARLGELRGGELSTEDHSILDRFEETFLSQLSDYGFTSFAVQDIYLGRDSYLPTHDGYDITFESSASDTIRTIWAYLLSMMEVSLANGGNHPGFLLLDEPRQQMTAKMSFGELLRHASSLARGQVIFATSEPETDLRAMMSGLGGRIHNFDGRLLVPVDR